MDEKLLSGLKDVYSDFVELEQVRARFIVAESQLRTEIKEKQEIDFSGAKGKFKGAGIAVAIYVGVLLLLATIVCHLWVDWFIILIGAALCFAMWNSKKVVAVIGGFVAVGGFLYLLKAFVVDTLIRAVKVGNYTALIVLTVITALFVVALILSNRLYVKKANEKIQAQNIDIRAMNEKLYDEINNLCAKEEEILGRIKKVLVSNGGFYPDKYAFLEAAKFFKDEKERMQSEYTMMQLIDRWEAKMDREYRERIDEEERQHRIFVAKSLKDINNYLNQVVQNQETIQRQLHFSNIMNLYQICQVSEINSNLNAINNRLYR